MARTGSGTAWPRRRRGDSMPSAESSAMLELLKLVPDAVVVTNGAGAIVLANPQAEQLFGCAGLVGKAIATFVGTAPNENSGRCSGATLEVRARRHDGTEFDAQMVTSLIEAGANRLLAWAIRDVSQLRWVQRRQQVLDAASASLASSLDYEATLRQVARSAVPALATWCVVDLVEPSGDIRLVAVAHADSAKEQLVHTLRQRYPFDPAAKHGLPSVVRTGRAVLYSAVQDAWRAAAARTPEHLDLMRALNAQSTLCAPLVAHGRILGAITLVSADLRRHYDESDLAFAEELGRRAGQAIDNARLYQEARSAREAAERDRRELEALNARLQAIQVVTDAALAHLPMDVLLRELLLRLRDILDVDTVAVLLLDPDDDTFVVRAAIGLDGEVEAGIRVPSGRGVAGRIASHAEPTIIDDLALVEVHSPVLRSSGIRALLGSPLRVEGRVLGVLHVGSRGPRHFAVEDARLLRLVADRVTLAISQSQLYESERAARENAERLAAQWEATLSQIADGVIVDDQAGRITFMNSAARELFGHAGAEPRRIEDLAIVDRSGDPLDKTPFGRALQADETVADAEVRFRRPDGTEIAAVGSAAPVVAPDGSRLGAVRTLHDVTAQRELERQREEFFDNASHDLRTPVATIKASMDVLLRNAPAELDPVLYRLLANVDREADRMATLVEDLLELTRLRSGNAPLRLASVDLRTVATRARDAVETLAHNRGQRIELRLPRGRLTGTVDADRLERALVNLLANANRYGREGGLIRLSLERRGQRAIFRVVDDGPGIPLADRRRIFERFYRADTETTRRSQGSGLGLPVVRAVAELHRGQVRVEATPGGGATFRVEVPLLPEHVEAAR